MNKITFKNCYLFLIALFFLAINNVTGQILPCVVHDNISAYGSMNLGQPQATFAIPNNYPITPKKFRIKFWKVQAISDSLKVNVNSNTNANYILNLSNTSININTGQYALGLYRVVLVCDNNVIESHNLIIQ